MQEIRRFKPSTVSRRFPVTAGFCRTCVIDGLLEHSPAEHVRRPSAPPESPTLGVTDLQFEALLTAARESPNPSDFALVAMLGLPGLRIFEATGADIADLGEEHGHRVLRVCGKGTKIVLIPLPPAVGRAIDHATGTRTSGPILLNSRGARIDRHAATRRLRRLAGTAGSGLPGHTLICSAILCDDHARCGVDLRDVQIAARHADPRTTMRYDNSRELHQAGEKPQVTRSRWSWNSGQGHQARGCLTRHAFGAIPSDAGSARRTVEAIGGFCSSAPRKERGCGSWTPTPGQRIRTVPIPDSASTARKNPGRHPNYILAAYMASGT